MKYYSTKNRYDRVTFKYAVLKGIADDGGLFMPEYIPTLNADYLNSKKNHSFKNIAHVVLNKFVEEDIPHYEFENIIDNIFTFTTPVIKLSNNIFIIELFHGPTLAFKDFGARFTAAVTEYFNKDENSKLYILVATSGDTGSAVANGFFNKKGIEVIVLYPKDKISNLQEKQITTLGGNVKSLEIEGTFDDCQRLVKQAFNDKSINKKLRLSSANSINIARLLPQMIYYFYAYFNLNITNEKIIFTVPSGNLGNLSAGLFAKKMGLPVFKFISALNENRVFENYVNNNVYIPRSSVKTLANAMDVGNPSNIERIIDLYRNNEAEFRETVLASSATNNDIITGIKEVYKKYGYIIDPHGAVGYVVTKKYLNSFTNDTKYVILETAHPAKFFETVEAALNEKIEIPDRLRRCIDQKKKTDVLSNDYEDFKDYLLSLNK
jgi:threonine synthase